MSDFDLAACNKKIKGFFSKGREFPMSSDANKSGGQENGLPEQADVSSGAQETEQPCCSGVCHIFYRGVSDDRLYVARVRHWNEVKYFRPRGLRVFCRDCRRRLL
jgi:hypothetical protein